MFDSNSSRSLLLFPGAIRCSIANTIFSLSHPDFVYSLSWHENNFSNNDFSGTRGTITFLTDGSLVGAFCSDESTENPFVSNRIKDYTHEPYFQGIPDELYRVANSEALQYLLDDVDGVAIPIITGAFWSDANQVTLQSAKPWPELWAHGASLFRLQLLEENESLDGLQEEYELTNQQVSLVRSLTSARLQAKRLPVEATAVQSSQIRRAASDGNALTACLESFQDLGILVP